MQTDVYTLRDHMDIRDLVQDNTILKYGRYPVVDSQNSPIGFLTRSDLVHYLSEQSLFLSEELQAVLNSVYNGVLMTNTDGIITILNHAAEYITTLNAADVIGKHIDSVIPSSGMPRVLKTGIAELNQQRQVAGSTIIANLCPVLKDNKIEAELEYVKNLKSSLESAIESMFEGVVLVDKTGKVTMINQAYCEFLGVKPSEVIGKKVADAIPNTRMHMVIKTGKAEIAEVQRIGNNNVVVARIPILKTGK